MPARKAASRRSGTPAAKKARPVRVAVRNKAVEETAVERLEREARDELIADISRAGFEASHQDIADTPAGRLRQTRDMYPELIEYTALHELRILKSKGLPLDACARALDMPLAATRRLNTRLRERLAVEAKALDPQAMVQELLDEHRACIAFSNSVIDDPDARTADKNRANADKKSSLDSMLKTLEVLGTFKGGHFAPKQQQEENQLSIAVSIRTAANAARQAAFGDNPVDVQWDLREAQDRYGYGHAGNLNEDNGEEE